MPSALRRLPKSPVMLKYHSRASATLPFLSFPSFTAPKPLHVSARPQRVMGVNRADRNPVWSRSFRLPARHLTNRRSSLLSAILSRTLSASRYQAGQHVSTRVAILQGGDSLWTDLSFSVALSPARLHAEQHFPEDRSDRRRFN